MMVERRKFAKVGHLEGLEKLGKPGQPRLFLLVEQSLPYDLNVRDSIYNEITRPDSPIRSGVVVFDDLGDIEAGKLSDGLRHIFSKRRHFGLDTFATFHSLNGVPPRIYQGNNYLVLWRTVEEPARAMEKTPEFKTVRKAYDMLRGTHGGEHIVIEQCVPMVRNGVRDRMAFLFVGTNGTGKTTEAVRRGLELCAASPEGCKFVLFIATEQPNNDSFWKDAGRIHFIHH